MSSVFTRLRSEVDHDHPSVPNAWVSMNTECKEKVNSPIVPNQAEMANEVNQLLGEVMATDRLPYMDADLVLRSPDLCQNVTGDGLHVNMWVDQVRASLLFNFLCNAKNEWVGNEAAFL